MRKDVKIWYTTFMYKYRPIQVHENGTISDDQHPSNAVGVFGDGALVAVYIHDPSRLDRIKNLTFFYVTMACALLLAVPVASQVSVGFAVGIVLLYLGLGGFLLWALVYPESKPAENAEMLKVAVHLTHGNTIDIVESNRRLLSKYPPDLD